MDIGNDNFEVFVDFYRSAFFRISAITPGFPFFGVAQRGEIPNPPISIGGAENISSFSLLLISSKI